MLLQSAYQLLESPALRQSCYVVLCLPQPLFADRWIGILTFWPIIETIDLACVGDHAYYEVTMPLLPYPRITSLLLQDMTALPTGTPMSVLGVFRFAVVFLSALYWASYRMNEL